jgi:hypothetical protein
MGKGGKSSTVVLRYEKQAAVIDVDVATKSEKAARPSILVAYKMG